MTSSSTPATLHLVLHTLLLGIGLLALAASIGDVFLLLAPLAVLLLWLWGVPAARREAAVAEFENHHLGERYAKDGTPGRGLRLEDYVGNRRVRWRVRRSDVRLSVATGPAVVLFGLVLTIPWLLVLSVMVFPTT